MNHSLIRLTLLIGWFSFSSVNGENWPQWRGPDGLGVSAETNLPTTWDSGTNVLWNVSLSMRSHSSAVTWKEKIFITGSSENGSKRILLCLNKNDGSEVWKREVIYDGEEPTEKDNGYCTATPVTDGKHVLAYYGSAGAYCYDMEGTLVWSHDFGDFFHIWGSATSPIIDQGIAYLYCGPAFEDRLVAVEVKSGKVLWEKNYVNAGWSTPLMISVAQHRELVLCSAGRVKAFNPLSGDLIWYIRGQKSISVASPLWNQELLFTQTGNPNKLIAIRPGGTKNVTNSHIVWQASGAPHIPSGVIYNHYIFMVNGDGIAVCLNAKNGETLSRRRLQGRFRCSLVAGDNKLYITNRSGETYVLEATPEMNIIGINPLPGIDFQATPALADGRLYIRGEDRLYCIGNR